MTGGYIGNIFGWIEQNVTDSSRVALDGDEPEALRQKRLLVPRGRSVIGKCVDCQHTVFSRPRNRKQAQMDTDSTRGKKYRLLFTTC